MGEEDVRRQKLNVFKMKALGTEVVARHQRQPDAARRHQRGDARLDGDRRAHALHHRQRRRAASVSDDGPRFPVGHRPRDAGSSAWSRSAGCPTSSSPASAAAATRPACSTRSSATPPSSWSASRPAAAATRRASTPRRSATASPACCTARFSYVLQDDDGQTADVHSVSAGLDYPGVGPEHSYWKDSGRVRYTSVGDDEALEGFSPVLAAGRHPAGPGDGPRRRRGDAHRGRSGAKEDVVVVCFSGRGDKDCFEVARLEGEEIA